MKKFEKKIEYTDTVEYQEFNKSVLLKVDLRDPNPKFYPGWNFVSKKEWKKLLRKNKNDVAKAAQQIEKSYVYPTPEFKNDLQTNPICFFFDTKFIKKYNFLENGMKQDPFEIVKKENFEDDLLWFNWSNHECFSLDDDIPVNSPLWYDYIGGRISSAYVDMDKAKEILENNKYVSQIEEHKVGWYNQDSCGSRAYQFVLSPPKEKWRKLVKLLIERGESYPTVTAKEVLIGQHNHDKELKKFDLLKMDKAYLPNRNEY